MEKATHSSVYSSIEKRLARRDKRKKNTNSLKKCLGHFSDYAGKRRIRSSKRSCMNSEAWNDFKSLDMYLSLHKINCQLLLQ